MSKRNLTPAADVPTPAPGRPERLDRRALASARLVRNGHPHKADLLELTWNGARILVKDFRRRSWWRRRIGRLQVSRESGAYRRIAGVPGFPRFLGRLDAYSLAVEKIPATSVFEGAGDRAADLRFVARLGRVVEQMHRRGVAHMDLRGVGNVLIDRSGRPFVVDLAAAIRFTPGGLLDRWIVRWLRYADLTGVLKWKARLVPDSVTADERRLLRRFRWVRRLWVFNLGHLSPSEASGGREAGAAPSATAPAAETADRRV